MEGIQLNERQIALIEEILLQAATISTTLKTVQEKIIGESKDT